MHEHAEIVIPPTDDVEAAVRQVMEGFIGEDTGLCEWWDYWEIGGRYDGRKVLARIAAERLRAFQRELTSRQVTVSSVTSGKPTLFPDSQIVAVDALWREWFPDCGESCLLFDHADPGRAANVCVVAEVTQHLTCNRLIIARKWNGKLDAAAMRVREFWNGVEWQDSRFDGFVLPVLREYSRVTEQCRWRVEDDWLVVTVDYHN